MVLQEHQGLLPQLPTSMVMVALVDVYTAAVAAHTVIVADAVVVYHNFEDTSKIIILIKKLELCYIISSYFLYGKRLQFFYF